MENRTRLIRVVAALALVVAAAVLTSGAVAASQRGAVVKVRQSSLGRILVDSHGRTLYLSGHDRRRKSTCYGKCARAWPPLITRGRPAAMSGARRGLLGTTRRLDGKLQVAYHGHPLYYFARDKRPGQVAGAGLNAFGGRWDPVSSAGAAVRKPVVSSGFKRPKLVHGLLTVEGTKASEKIALRLKAGDPGLLQVDVGDNGSADFTFKSKLVAMIAVNALGGDDLVRIDESNGLFTDSRPTKLDGGSGNDRLVGGSGAEILLGGEGNDTLDGNGGNDRALLGAGDDTFVWDPGDGSDVVEGEAGADTMRFNGANIAEQVDLSANGNRLRFFRTQGNITMDTAGVERVDFNALGGADLVTVNNLAGTGLSSLNVDLQGVAATGDGQPDRIVVNGTNGDDTITVNGDAGGVKVSGLAATVAILHPEGANDRLELNTLDGRDSVDASGLAAGAIQFVVDAGAGNDSISGSQGADKLLGGDGNDWIDGNKGNDLALMGAGDDLFVWDPGDGSDVVEGEAGADTMRFNGADVPERVAVSPNGGRVRFLRDPGRVTMDTAGVERIDFEALGGFDVVNVDDLSGTDLANLNVDLERAPGSGDGDGQPDRVDVNGTNGGDAIHVSGDASGVAVAGLRTLVAIRHQELTDVLGVNGLDGNDDISAAGLAAQAITTVFDGREGDDSIFGSLGADTLVGADGNDTVDGFKGNDLAILGRGDDLFFWDPGDGSDIVDGEEGFDEMSFIGANIAEQIDVSAQGNRVRFARDIGGVTMDTGGLERIDFEALAGADKVTVGDLTGTDLGSLQVDLDGGANGGDGEPDNVIVNGTNGDDAITVKGDAGGVKGGVAVGGLAAAVGILHPEANDRLDVNTLDGRDTVDSTELAPGTIQLFVDGMRQ